MVDLAKGDAVRNTTQVCLSVTSDLGLLERDVTISTSVDESGKLEIYVAVYISNVRNSVIYLWVHRPILSNFKVH